MSDDVKWEGTEYLIWFLLYYLVILIIAIVVTL
jgi:hypothetical protein